MNRRTLVPRQLSIDTAVPTHLDPLPQTTGERRPEVKTPSAPSVPSPLSCKGEGQGEGFAVRQFNNHWNQL